MQKMTFQNYSVDIVNILDEESRGYDGVTLFYLLKGVVAVQTSREKVTLNPQDLLLINQYENYHLTSLGDNIIVRVAISHRYFSRYYTHYAAARFSIEIDDNHQHLKMLREIITQLAISKLQSHKETGLLEINALLSSLLSLLIMYFKRKKPHAEKESQTGYSSRIENTLIYLQENYNKPLSLSLLAKINHTSEAYFSRLFSREVGISFKTYLTQLRFMFCIEALSRSQKPLYQIVEENGFSDTRHFTALFKSKYAMTPHQYRALSRAGKSPAHVIYDLPKQAPATRPPRFGEVHPAELLSLLASSMSTHEQMVDIEQVTTEKVTFTLGEKRDTTAPLPHPVYMAKVGHLEELLKSTVQQQIISARQQMPLKYIQVDQIFAEKTLPTHLLTDEPWPSFSHYACADTTVAFLRQQGVALLISLHFQATEEEMRTISIRFLDFIAHNMTLFGEDYVSSWALSYHPNVDYPEESETRFLRLRNALKAILPRMQTGIYYPFPHEKKAMAEIPFFASNLAKQIDFLGFSANANDKIRRKGFGKEDMADTEFFVQRQALTIVEQLNKNGLTTPLFLETWNTLTGDTRQTNGAFFRGALLMNTLLSLTEHVTCVGFWINSEVQHEMREEKHIDTSSLSLFFVGPTRRPMFHVLRLRERLTGAVAAKGENYLVTREGQGYRVLLTNSVTFNPCLSLQEHLMKGFRKQLSVTISGMEPGTYQIKRHLFDQQHGALFHQFECQPTRYGRDSEVMQFIDLHSSPDLHLYDENINTCWKICVEMDVNALCLFEINRITTP